ncbi:MAG: acyl-homoserine-lactone synthase [Pseudomonadota bacterium]
MLRYVRGRDLHLFPRLQESMFADRACQFRDRLGWAVRVDDRGWERDEYDRMDPVYVIWQRPDGRHAGSMRFLPTDGPHMLADHFARLAPEPVRDARIWECTRFCLSRDAPPATAARLMLAGCELGLGFGLAASVGVFDHRMIRIYRALGWPPEILGGEGQGVDAIHLGLWRFGEPQRRRLAVRAGIAPDLSRLWFLRAFGDRTLARAG